MDADAEPPHYFDEPQQSSSASSLVEDKEESSIVSEPSAVSRACSSGIFGALVRTRSRSSTKSQGIGELKEPWVPAPGRCSRALKKSLGTCSFESQHMLGQKQLHSAIPKPVENVKSSHSSVAGSMERKPSKSGKKRRPKKRGTEDVTGYKLESKDSLVEVTATLKAQREEVLQLWQQNVQENASPEILVQLQKANNLAIEATQEVTRLRDKIQHYKTTPKKLSVNGSKSLEKIRDNILTKLHEFEECRSHVQVILNEGTSINPFESGFDPKVNDKSPVHRSVSQTSSVALEMESKARNSDFEYIKHPGKLSELASESEEEIGIRNDALNQNFNQLATKVNKPDSRVDFEELIHPVQGDVNHDAHSITPRGRKSSRPINESSYYREKIVSLQRKLMDQEFRHDEMQRKLASIETKNDFDIQLLKNNMKNQIQELSPIPEMVEIAEKRLNETLQAKFAMENEIQLKTQDLNNLKKEVDRLGKELGEEKRRSEKVEKLLQKKLDSAEAEIKSLRKELLKRVDRISTLECKEITHEGFEISEEKMYILEDKIMELDHELNMERKHRAIAEHAKDNIAAQKDHQIAQLMNELEATQQKNQKLKTQLEIVKNSYHDMFSPYLAQAENTIQSMFASDGGSGRGDAFTTNTSEKKASRREK